MNDWPQRLWDSAGDIRSFGWTALIAAVVVLVAIGSFVNGRLEIGAFLLFVALRLLGLGAIVAGRLPERRSRTFH